MRLVIIGAGFAGMYAALSAARLRDIQGVSPEELEIALVAPEPTLVVRPRLYEPKPETLTAPLLDVLKAIDVTYVQGSAETVDTKSRTLQIAAGKDTRKTLVLRPPGRRHRQPAVSSEHSRPRRARFQRRFARRRGCARHASSGPRQTPRHERAGHGRRRRRWIHRIEAATELLGAAAKDLRRQGKTAHHHRRSKSCDCTRHGRRPRAR